MSGTKKYTEELQNQVVMRDEEIVGLNTHVDNLVSQNRERADYFAEEMTKRDDVVRLLQEHETKVEILEKNLEDFRKERELETATLQREIDVLNGGLLAEREVNERAREEAAKSQENYDRMQLEWVEKHHALEAKLVGEIDALHQEYKGQLREKEDTMDRMKEENILLSSKSAAAELAKTEILSKYTEAKLI